MYRGVLAASQKCAGRGQSQRRGAMQLPHSLAFGVRSGLPQLAQGWP